MRDKNIKILLIGESGVGKSSLITRFVDGKFNDDEQTTIGIDYKVKTIEMDDGRELNLQIWDTAGQERFKTLIPSYYRNAKGVILVYDVSKKCSFQKLDSWLEELDFNSNGNVTKLVVGNKIDKSSERTVDRESGIQFAKKNRCIFLECSAKDDVNVQMVFSELAKNISFDTRNIHIQLGRSNSSTQSCIC